MTEQDNYHDMDDHTLLVLATRKLDKLNGTVARNVLQISEIETRQKNNIENIANLWEKNGWNSCPQFDNCLHFSFKQFLIVIIVIATIAVGGTLTAVDYLQ